MSGGWSRRVDGVNAAAVAVALAASVALPGLWRAPATGTRVTSAEQAPGTARRGPRRIASASTVADQLLLALCEPDRIAAFTSTSAEQGPWAHRYAGRPTIASLDDVEAVIALSPDLVIASNVASERRVARLEEAGVRVVDLGPPTGWEALREDIAIVAEICGDRGRGERLARALARRLEEIADDVPPGRRRSAVYAVVLGGRIYGGTVGTSYHDVIRYAGLNDAAAGAQRGAPQYATEELLALDPDVVVTRRGAGEALCGQPGLGSLRACQAGDVIEIDGARLDDPGLGMIDAAAILHEAVYER